MSLWHLEAPATGCGGSGRMLSPLTRALSHLAPGPCWDPVAGIPARRSRPGSPSSRPRDPAQPLCGLGNILSLSASFPSSVVGIKLDKTL